MNQTSISYQLRPHHGLCMAFFEGKGYSKEFVAHMYHLLEELPGKTITLTMETDSICSHCPNRNNTLCSSQEKVAHIDSQVATLCNFYDGQSLTYESFRQIVWENVIQAGNFESICKACQWFSICNEKQSKKIALL